MLFYRRELVGGVVGHEKEGVHTIKVTTIENTLQNRAASENVVRSSRKHTWNREVEWVAVWRRK